MNTLKKLLSIVGLWLAVSMATHAGTVTYIYTDNQGTPLAEADAQGNVTATFDYRPYGAQALGTPPKGPGYTGHVNDPDTGLVYMQARYYDPAVGRFLSIDPVSPEAGKFFNFNRFTYGNDNPLVNTDPDGRQNADDFAKLKVCGDAACTLVPDRKGVYQVVPTYYAAQSSLADSMNTNIGSLDQASGAQIAKGADNVSGTMAAISISVPPLSVVAAPIDVTASIIAFVADPSIERGVNVATAGLLGVAKAMAKGSEKAKSAVELAEKVSSTKTATDAAKEADKEDKKTQ
jgi:RHS repeat-associated protein